MNRQPQLMDVTRMRDILTPHLSQMREHIFMNSELAMVRGDSTVFSLLMRQKPPFTINDHRFGIVISGEADINFNLQDRHLTSGTLVYIGPGTIIHPKRLSPDFRIFGMALFTNFPIPFAQGQMPSAFNGQVRDFQLPVSEEDIATVKNIMDIIWQIVHASDDYHRPTVTALVTIPPAGHPTLCRTSSDWLLCRAHVPHRTIPEHRYPPNQRHHSKRLDRPCPHHPHQNRTAPHRQAGSADS